MSLRSSAATLVFPRLPDDDHDTPLPITPATAATPQSTTDVLAGFVRRHHSEPPVKVYDLEQRRQASAAPAEEMDAFQKVR
jgi:hypothetical protein